MGRMHVAHLETGALAGQTTRSERRQAALVGDLRQRVGLIHELRQLRGTEELAHGRGRRLCVDEVLRHDGVDLDRRHALLDRPLHPQETDAVLVLHQLADRTDATVAEIVDVVDFALAVAQVHESTDDREDVLAAQRANRILGVYVETHVHLHTADGRKVVALRIEEQRLEHRLGGLHRRRLARPHDAVDVEQRILPALVLVDGQRVADVSADIDVVDVEDVDLVGAELHQLDQIALLLAGLGVDGHFKLVAGFEIDLARLRVDDVLGDVGTDEVLFRHADRLDALLGQLAGLARSDLLARLDQHFARIRIDEVDELALATHALDRERHAPAVLVLLEPHLVVEGVEDFLAVHAERHQQARHRNLATPVDTRVHDILGIELDVQPGTAIGNDPRGEKQLARRMRLALVMVEENARRAVHLRDDDALGAVHDEGAVVGHERHVAHEDVLLLDVLDGLGAGVLVDVEHDEAQRHLQRRGIGQVALPAFVDVELRRLELVLDELEHRLARKVGDREDRLEDRLQAFVAASADGLVDHQELIVGSFLDLDEVGHRGDFGDRPEELANPLATAERRRVRHRRSFS